MIMCFFKKKSVRFICTGEECKVIGYPELEGYSGLMIGDGMAFFRPRYRELYIANTKTGKIRKISKRYERKEESSFWELINRYDQLLLVDDSEIDYKAISDEFTKEGYALSNARNKAISYREIGTCYGFKNGYCAICWELESRGTYHEDEFCRPCPNKYAKEVYAIINKDLEIVEPFRPVKDLNKYLEEIEKKYGSQ